MSEINFTFGIKSIDILEFSYVHPKNTFPENASFRFETNIEQKVNLEKANIYVISTFHIHCESTGEKLGNAVVSCVYGIENIKQFINENNVFELPEQIVVLFNSISISTCRGVLFTLFRGTPLHSVVLPVIDPKEFTKQKPL